MDCPDSLIFFLSGHFMILCLPKYRISLCSDIGTVKLWLANGFGKVNFLFI